MFRVDSGKWQKLNRLWHGGARPPIVMVYVHCDESHDDATYTLGGWIAPDSAWDNFDPAWNEMLGIVPMPDGSRMPGFHSSEICGRDQISDSRFKGWEFPEEKLAFSSAIDVLERQPLCTNLWPVTVSAAIPTGSLKDHDEAWLMLFVLFLFKMLLKYRAQNGFSFIFDEKESVRRRVDVSYYAAKQFIDELLPGKLRGSSVAFVNDEDVPGVQAADLLTYEIRRRNSEAILKPEKALRKSYERLIELRRDNAMHEYLDPQRMLRVAEKARATNQSLLKAMWNEISGLAPV